MRFRIILSVGIFSLLLFHGAEIIKADDTIGKYQLYELVFKADNIPENPFDTYLLKLEVTDPNGKTFTMDGFYDGDGKGGQNGKTWRARICPYLTGIWSWRTVPGDMLDKGLEDLKGQFRCVTTIFEAEMIFVCY